MTFKSHRSQHEYFPATKELVWRGHRYVCIASGDDLIADLAHDHGPIVSVEPRYESMGVAYIQVFFYNKTYTGAEIKSSSDVRRAFELTVDYIKKYNGNIIPQIFNFCFDSGKFTQDKLNSAIANEYKTFPGARKMGLSFKEAVEHYLRIKYGDRIGRDLTRSDIFNDDRKLYQAIDNYKTLFGKVPFDIPSVHDIARERLERVARMGAKNASPLDRKAAHRLARRLAEHAEKNSLPEAERADASS